LERAAGRRMRKCWPTSTRELQTLQLMTNHAIMSRPWRRVATFGRRQETRSRTKHGRSYNINLCKTDLYDNIPTAMPQCSLSGTNIFGHTARWIYLQSGHLLVPCTQKSCIFLRAKFQCDCTRGAEDIGNLKRLKIGHFRQIWASKIPVYPKGNTAIVEIGPKNQCFVILRCFCS